MVSNYFFIIFMGHNTRLCTCAATNFSRNHAKPAAKNL
jgi:hypothetical protein